MSDKLNFDMVRDATVSVEGGTNRNGKPQATILINDQYRHTFPAKSRVSNALRTTTPAKIAERLSGGDYFMVDGELHSFRDGRSAGAVHSDENIARLAEVIGFTRKGGVEVHSNTHSPVVLGRKWSDSPILVPEYAEGGKFNSELHFGWSPFVHTVNSAFMIMRLICSNGMMGMRDFLKSRTPLVNHFEEHLEIANEQLQEKVNGVMTRRLRQMGHENASVGELQRVVEYAQRRLDENLNLSDTDARTLNGIVNALDPVEHLKDVYKPNVFKDKTLADQMRGHMSVIELYNALTEMRSHTVETPGATTGALDTLSNKVVFDRKDLTQGDGRFGKTVNESFESAQNAFFGVVNDDTGVADE